MPLVTLTLREGRPRREHDAILDAVHGALVRAGVPAEDRFQRVLELPESRFRFDPRYPDVASPRPEGFVLIEVLWSIGRNVKIKRALASDIAREVGRAADVSAEDVMIVFVETTWENWAFARGALLHA